MNTEQINTENLQVSGNPFYGSRGQTDYMWGNLVNERRASSSWIRRSYKGSIFYAFWSVLSSPVGEEDRRGSFKSGN